MYISAIIEKSYMLNCFIRIRTKSGDTLEGKFVEHPRDPVSDPLGGTGLLEFQCKNGGKTYLHINVIETMTMVDNLTLLEEKASERANL